jgi:hypothetical protein
MSVAILNGNGFREEIAEICIRFFYSTKDSITLTLTSLVLSTNLYVGVTFGEFQIQ